jgi:glycosyltransferase involved in cell wall biosynthesis
MGNNALFVMDSKLTLSEAPSSRFIYIAKSLQKKEFKTEIIGRKGDKIEGLKTLQISGSKNISRLKILLYAYARTFCCHYHTVIVRGGIIAPFLLPLKVFGTKVVLDFHGWLFQEIRLFYMKTVYNKLKAFFYYAIERISAENSTAIICNSKEFRRMLGRMQGKSVIVLENGLDFEEGIRAVYDSEKEKEQIYRKNSIPKNRPLIGFLGNWHGYDDMETMFKGAKIAKAHAVVIGEGPDLNEFKKSWSNVTFTGRLERYEALKTISLCNAAIVPLKSIYYPTRKVKDYLSLGKPIVMASVRGREAYLVPNKNVLLYEPGNAEDLADKIRTIVSDKGLAEEMSKSNSELARQFDWQILVEQSGLIEKILSN